MWLRFPCPTQYSMPTPTPVARFGWSRHPIRIPQRHEGDTMFGKAYLCVAGCPSAGVRVGLGAAQSQPRKAETPAGADEERAATAKSLGFTEQLLARKIDEQTLFQALADVAQCDKVRYTGPP